MNVRTINMGSYDKCVFSLGESHGCLIPNLVCFLRCDFSGLKGLPNLICNHIMCLGSSRDMLILPFGKQKFFITGLCITGIRTNVFSIFRLCCILRIISTVSQTLRYRLSLLICSAISLVAAIFIFLHLKRATRRQLLPIYYSHFNIRSRS